MANLFVLGLFFVYFVCFCVFIFSNSAVDFLDRLVSKITYCVSSGTLIHPHSLLTFRACRVLLQFAVLLYCTM